jgi:putative transposase
MPDMMMVLTCFNQVIAHTTCRQLGRVIEAILAISGRITIKGLSRWSAKGGSYRTLQRFFTTPLNWLQLNWLMIRHHLWDADDITLISGDHVVVTKAGKATYGLDRFFSSLYGQAVPGLCFLSLSLLSVKRRTSYPMVTEQMDKSLEPLVQVPSRKKQVTRGRRGRPKGSQNRYRLEADLSPSLRFVQSHLMKVLEQIGETLQVTYFVFDGAFGHHEALRMVRQTGLHLISKLQYNSALYLPYTGGYAGRGPRRKYGQKLDYQNLPPKFLKSTAIEKEIKTQIYQMSPWHKKFMERLNIVVIVKTNLKTHKRAHVVLFSSDLGLAYENLIDYYRLRFQIEFNFRDAKPYWGLEDFMSVNERPVYNSANLARFMVNVSQALIRPMRDDWPTFSVNDLKAWFRGQNYVVELLKLLPEPPESILIDQIVPQMAALGRVNHPVSTS